MKVASCESLRIVFITINITHYVTVIRNIYFIFLFTYTSFCVIIIILKEGLTERRILS